MSEEIEIKKRPAFQFYPGDWRKDVELRACSLAARGLWIDLMCVMHECDPYGHLSLNGAPMTPAKIAGQIGVTPQQVKKLLDELIENGVARKTENGTIYSKRMVDDERTRNARANGGKAGSEHGFKGAEHGAKGGRPSSSKGGYETPLPTDLKPPPSSSSSSSPSEETHTESSPPPMARAPSLAGQVCMAMKAAGISDINPGHLDLLKLIEAGATLDEFIGAASEARAKSKGFAYAVGTVKRRREEAAKAAPLHQGAMPQRPPTQAELNTLAAGHAMGVYGSFDPNPRHHQQPETVDVESRLIAS